MVIKFAVRAAACLAIASVFSPWLVAQQAGQPAARDSAQAQQQGQSQDKPSAAAPQSQSDKDKNPQQQTPPPPTSQEQSGTSKDRLFYTLPNFLTLESRKQLPPLSTGQKFWVVTRGSFDYIQIPWYGFLSAVSQAQDSEPGLGQGWGGYGKRFATSFADGTIENYMVGAVVPSLLKEDPRYYQLGVGSFGHRTWYAATRNIITLKDSGKKEFNYSEIFGGAFSAAFSTYTYHPKSHIFMTAHGPTFVGSDRTLTNTAKVWGTQFGYDTLTLVVKEFWPDVHRAIIRSRHKHDAVAPAGAGSQP